MSLAYNMTFPKTITVSLFLIRPVLLPDDPQSALLMMAVHSGLETLMCHFDDKGG